MKTKKLLYTGCFMAASMLLLTSCGDFLDEDPKGQLNPETFYTIEGKRLRIYTLPFIVKVLTFAP